MELTKEYFESHLEEQLEKFGSKVNTDIENLAIMVAKGFENTATKDDLLEFAKKSDLVNFATKDDIAKVEANIATKDDIADVKNDITEIKIELVEIKDSINNLDKRTNEDSIAIIKDIIYLNKEVKLLKSSR